MQSQDSKRCQHNIHHELPGEVVERYSLMLLNLFPTSSPPPGARRGARPPRASAPPAARAAALPRSATPRAGPAGEPPNREVKILQNNCKLGCAAELEAAIVKSLRTSAPIFSCHTDGCSESRRPAYRHRGLPIRAVVSLLRSTKTKKNEENIFKKRKKCTILQRSKLILVNYQIAICVKFKRNVAKLCQILKFQPDYLLDRKKYCKTNIFMDIHQYLQKSLLLQPKTGQMLSKL